MWLIDEVRAQLRAVLAAGTPASFLLAVSGGPDSVALLDVFARLARPFGLRLGIAHVNYGLRGEASLEDARFVESLATSYDVPMFARTLEPHESQMVARQSLQATARRVRYAFFEETAAREGYSFVGLAHHADDQVETFLANLVRGAGPAGLKGMARLSSGRFFRPFLGVERAQILKYLDARRLPYREDASNLDERFLRVRIRRHVTGPLLALRPSVRQSILHAMEILAADAVLLDRLADQERAGVMRDGELDLVALTRLPLALRRRVVRESIRGATGREPGFRLVERVLGLADAGRNGACVRLGAKLVAQRSRGRLSIGPP